uniref:Uncharacterized protein n=1 Tax=Buteo japonicus TaxID=224669 RepID=A0A8B9Z8L5_9AVES
FPGCFNRATAQTPSAACQGLQSQPRLGGGGGLDPKHPTSVGHPGMPRSVSPTSGQFGVRGAWLLPTEPPGTGPERPQVSLWQRGWDPALVGAWAVGFSGCHPFSHCNPVCWLPKVPPSPHQNAGSEESTGTPRPEPRVSGP